MVEAINTQLVSDVCPPYTRYYLGSRYETDVMGNSQKHRLYIGGDAYTAPAVYMNTGNEVFIMIQPSGACSCISSGKLSTIGAFQFSTQLSLTTGASAQS